MLDLKKIAITGGVASGKTSVCRYFKELGAFVVSADEIVHTLLTHDPSLGREISRRFGSEILQGDQINRKTLAEKVFEDPKQLDWLEKLLHPIVLKKIKELYAEAKRERRYTAFVVEIPLLFEIRGESFYDDVVTVLVDERLARQRFEQAGFKPQDYDRRMRRQLSPDQKAARANFTIQNNGSLEELKEKVLLLNQTIMQQP